MRKALSLRSCADLIFLYMGWSGLLTVVCSRGAGPICAARANLPEDLRDVRVIVFPADRSLGQLSIREAGSKGSENWTTLGEARGMVEVPRHKETRLDMSGETYRDISCLKQVGPNDLQELAVYSQNLRDADVECLAGLTGLKRLEMSGSVTARGLAWLKAMKSLRELWLVRTDVDDEGLAHLAGLGSLDTVCSWSNSRITGIGFRHLVDAPALRKLDFYETPINDEGMTYISQISSLEELSLQYTDVTDIGISRLARLPRLRHLVVPPKATDEGLASLKAAPRLESLDIADTRITDSGLTHLKDMKHVKSLSISSALMTGEGVTHLKGLAALESVTLILRMITSDGLARMAGLPVVNLNLSGTAIGDSDLVHLRNLPCLRSLSLRNTGVTTTGLSYLKDLSGLQSLNLGYTKITDDGVSHLGAIASLRSLDLTGCQVSDDALSSLKRLGDLEELNLRKTRVTNAGVRMIEAALPGCRVTGPERPRGDSDTPDLNAEAESMVGKQAPQLEFRGILQASPGTQTTWDELKGKAVVLEFWATTCGPCVDALPHINALAGKFKDRPVQFIFITAEQQPIVAEFLGRYLIKGWIALDREGATYESYRVKSIPRTVVVDPSGVIVHVTIPTNLTKEMLNKLLAK